MKIYSVIVVYDVTCVAETPEAALATIRQAIANVEDPLTPSEMNTIEATTERNIRDAWVRVPPFVSEDVSDADFAKLKGKTSGEICKMINEREAAKKAK